MAATKPMARPTLVQDLLNVSRFDRYNPLLACFAGVWSTLLAGANKLQDDPGSIPVSFIFRQTLLCFLYCWILCGAGMVWNDWVDRDIDAEVERTKSRPLASGRLSTTVALSWMMAQFLSSVVILAYMLDGQDIMSSLLPVTLGTIFYPYGKRPVARSMGIYPQYILGFTLAYPAVSGWVSIYGPGDSIEQTLSHCFPQMLFFFLWTLYFNTAYSYQDIRDDAKMGVNSIYVLAGKYIHPFLVLLAGGVLCTMPYILYPIQSSWLWFSWMGVWTLSIVEQLIRFDTRKPETGGFVHRRNFALGIWNIAACTIELLLRV